MRKREENKNRNKPTLTKNMSGRVPEGMLAFLILESVNFQGRVTLERPPDVPLLPIHRGRDGFLSQALGEFLGDFEGGGLARNGIDLLPIFQGHLDGYFLDGLLGQLGFLPKAKSFSEERWFRKLARVKRFRLGGLSLRRGGWSWLRVGHNSQRCSKCPKVLGERECVGRERKREKLQKRDTPPHSQLAACPHKRVCH